MRSTAQKPLPGILVIGVIIAGCILYAPLLYFIDEGRHSLDGMFDKGNIMGLSVYAMFAIALTFLIFLILIKLMRQVPGLVITFLFGPLIRYSILVVLAILVFSHLLGNAWF